MNIKLLAENQRVAVVKTVVDKEGKKHEKGEKCRVLGFAKDADGNPNLVRLQFSNKHTADVSGDHIIAILENIE